MQTELHDAKHQPDIENGKEIGMPLEEFTEEMWRGLCEGKEEVPVGMAKMSFGEEGFETKRQAAFKGMVAKGAGKL